MSDFQTHVCPACAAGIFEECSNPQFFADDGGGAWMMPCAFAFANQTSEVGPNGKGGLVGRPVAKPGDVTDPTSTGRKRAAMLAPILEGQTCSWAGLRHAGGGPVPILGCNGNRLIEQKGGDESRGLRQGDRHHGPDKNTLNNSVGLNLHSICADCHHRWHALNDEFYGERPHAQFPFVPIEAYYLHDPSTKFSPEEYEQAELWWSLPVKAREAYPFIPGGAAELVFPVSGDPATLEPSLNPFFSENDPFEIGDHE